jgi:hypothetical protein
MQYVGLRADTAVVVVRFHPSGELVTARNPLPGGVNEDSSG